MASIWDLPDELMELVLAYLPLADIKNMRLVCCRWRDVSYSTRIIKKIQTTLQNYSDLNKLNFGGRFANIKILQVENGLWNSDDLKEVEEGDRNCAEFWSSCGTHVNELAMFVVDEQTEFLKEIFPNTPRLKKLDLCDCEDRTNREKATKIRKKTDLKPCEIPPLIHLSFPCLASLKISVWNGLTGDRLRVLVENAPVLEGLALTFEHFYNLKPDLIDALDLFTSCRKNTLRRLELESCDIKDSQLNKIVSNLCPQMMELHLRDCPSLTDKCLPVICEKVPNLKKITLNSGHFTDEHLQSLLLSLIHLTHFALVRVEFGQLTVAAIPRMREISSVCLSSQVSCDFKFWKHFYLGSEYLLNLKELRLVYTPLIDRTVRVIVNVLPNLITLYLDENQFLTKQSVEYIVCYCEKLEVLSLRGCCAIKDISSLVSLKHLQKLDVYCCNIKDKTVWDQLRKVKVTRKWCWKATNLPDDKFKVNPDDPIPPWMWSASDDDEPAAADD